MRRDIWTIGKILRWTQEFFAGKGIASPRLDAEVLLAYVLKKERVYLYVHFDEPLNENELTAYRELIKKRVSRVPVAYLLGYREFMGLRFKVTEHTLIPRPETEILVQRVLEELKNFSGEVLYGADIGTGTGAIAISLAKNRADLFVQGVDISPEALTVAQTNAAEIGVAEQIEFTEGNLLESLKRETYDFIVSNPPYIPTADIKTLMPEVLCEPKTALDGGTDGLDFYRLLAQNAPARLNPGGFIAAEIGINQAEAVVELFQTNGIISSVDVYPDLAKIDRVVVARR